MATVQNQKTSNAEKDVEQQELSFTTTGKKNSTAALENSLAVSYKTKHNPNTRSDIRAPCYLPK